MASLRFNKRGLASGTVEICQFPYNCLGAQVDTMQFFDADGLEITDTVATGCVRYQYLSADDGSEWRNFDIAPINNVQDGSNQVPHVIGNRVAKVRATFTGFPEGTTFNAWCFGYSFPNPIIDSRVVGGVKAFNVQSFTENNCKNGTQHEFSVYIPSLAAGASYYIAIQTSDDPILVKSFNVQFDGALTSAVWFKSPTIATLPTPITVYNLNDELAVPFKSSVYLNVTPSSSGEQISPLFVSIGNEGSNNKKVSSDSESPDAGLERVLWRNRLYLWKITNENADACKVSILASMYEGGLSIER